MSIVNRIKKLCDSRNTTLIGLEREIGLGRGTIRKWESYSPSIDKLEKVADYFKVSTDYLLGISASAIIEDRLEEMGMTLEEAVAKTKGVSLYWLQNLETFIPGELGGQNDVAYKWITQIAEALGLPSKKLKAALARQEIPAYDGPRSSIEEDFGNEDFDNETPNFSNPYELQELLETLHKRPEMKTLFSVTKNATKEDIEKAVKIIEALKDE